MKCPHCHSLMEIYDRQASRLSEVAFYRCTVCLAQHVSSAMLAAGQLNHVPPESRHFSRNGSQNGAFSAR